MNSGNDVAEIPAISLWQPWAHLMAIGAKRFETRSWSTSHRGRMAIHAAKHWNVGLAQQCYNEPFFKILSQSGVKLPIRCESRRLPSCGFAFGAIVAIADLIECLPTDGDPPKMVGIHSPEERAFGDYSYGRYAWRYENLIRLPEPIPCVGRQGIFRVRLPDIQ